MTVDPLVRPRNAATARRSLPMLAWALALSPFAAGEDATPPTNPTIPAESRVQADQGHDQGQAAAPGATPAATRWYSISGTLAIGYDSNILLEPDTNPSSSDKQGASLGLDVKGTARLIDAEGKGLTVASGHARRLSATVSVGAHEYSGHPEAELLRIGAQLMGHQRVESWDPGFIVGYNHYDLDRRNAADAINLDLFASRIAPSFEHVDVVLLGGERLVYPLDDNKTGTLLELGYRHWFLIERRDIHRRIEAGLGVSSYAANADFESYRGITPSVAALWRIGSGQRLGTYDLSGSAQYEFRQFKSFSGITEKQDILGISGGCDAWVCANATAGIYAGVARRGSNLPANEYTRYQIGLRLGATW